MASQPQDSEGCLENQCLSNQEFKQLVRGNMKFKSRSYDTYHKMHFVELSTNPTESVDVVLIGDSMLERFKTTGAQTRTARLPSFFNAGVGGDRIENVLFRLNLGTMEQLEERNVKLWVVMVGTNNLKMALKPAEVERYRILLQALLRVSPTSQILACELFQRTDIDGRYVDESNDSLLAVINEMNANLGERIYWLTAPVAVTKDRLADHVHLDEEGYRIWDEILYPRITDLIENT